MRPIIEKLAHSLPASVLWSYRVITAASRCLPHFIIVGTQKGGTTSLYHYLSQHPQIIPSQKKEVHFFDLHYRRGLSWYKAHFPRSKNLRVTERVFEASPSYLYHPLVPARIAEMVPQARLILLLRDPTERAISQYFHERRLGHESLTIMDALLAEEERLKPLVENRDFTHKYFFYAAYKSRGHYAEQIVRYLEYFKRENMLILNSESLFSEPVETLKKVTRFVGVDTDFSIRDFSARNVSDNRTSVDNEVHQYLDAYFFPYNERLFSLLGEDFGWNSRAV